MDVCKTIFYCITEDIGGKATIAVKPLNNNKLCIGLTNKRNGMTGLYRSLITLEMEDAVRLRDALDTYLKTK